jgi:hypothetical protein
VKNFYGWLLLANGKDLARLSGYPNDPYAEKIFHDWMHETPGFREHGFHNLDMFFWEDRAMNWAVGAKNTFQMVANYTTVFNSRLFFDTLLGTARRHRDAQLHHIFLSLLRQSEVVTKNIPINPTRRKGQIKKLKQLGLYWIYRNIAIKTGYLKFK